MNSTTRILPAHTSPVAASADHSGAWPRNDAPVARLQSAARSTGRFLLHFTEMWLAMTAGMMVFHALPVSHELPPALHQVGMAAFMTAPMVLWMRVRGHGWRHGAEMAAGMLVPWATILVLVGLGADRALPWLAQAGDASMLLGMVAVMLMRREHYAHGMGGAHASGRASRIRIRPVIKPAVYLGAIVIVPLLVGTANLAVKMQNVEPQQPPPFSGVLPEPLALDPSKKTAVVLSSAYGAEVTDTLPTFEILARSGAFNVYSVAPERTLLPLVDSTLRATSLDFVPHFSYVDYETRIGTPPDLIAIPYFPNYTAERDAVVLDWIRAHAGPHTTILTICAGTEILADTGLLDGRTATTNTGWFERLETRVPTATWVRNVRYVDDGDIVTSTNLASGIDATLHVVDRFAGRASALDVARQIGYTATGALDDPSFDPPPLPLLTIAANAAFVGQQRLGVLLYDGVSELGLAATLDPYASSLSSRPFVIAPERRVVRSQDGFGFVPRYDFNSAPTQDRMLVPAGSNVDGRAQVVAAWSGIRPERAAEEIYRNVGRGETAYDATFKDLARGQNRAVALADAEILFYALDPSELPENGLVPAQLVTPVLLSLLGAVGVFGASRLPTLRRAPQRA